METQETRSMVDRCNKCGLCISACPTYQQILTEAASPRGRVQQIKNYLEGNVELTKRFKEIILTDRETAQGQSEAFPGPV